MSILSFTAKVAIAIGAFFTLCADSITQSKSQLQHHFGQDQSYPYAAARAGIAEANWHLYQISGSSHWLQQAALNGHIDAAYHWYLEDKSRRRVWLKSAADSGHQGAMITQIDEIVEQKQWHQAKSLLEQRMREPMGFDPEQLAKIGQLKAVVDLALATQAQIVISADETEPAQLVNNQCRIQIQPLIAKPAYAQQVKRYQRGLAESGFADLPICMKDAIAVPELQASCNRDALGRVECSLPKLAKLVETYDIDPQVTQLLVLVEQGTANTRGGLMFLDSRDNKNVFLHELAHWLGFVDEYRIGPLQQQQLCTVDEFGFVGINLFITAKSVSKQRAEQLANARLYPAQTCAGSDFQAYKFTEKEGFMEYLEQPISEFDIALFKQNLNWSQIVPAAMNFAHVFKEDRDLYLSYVKQAAGNGYQGAITEFSKYLIEQGSYLAAKDWLEFGAEQGGINSKLLLGHAYLEGRWLPRDLQESASWYKKAAEQNDGYGLYFYGKCLEMGWGCIQSKEQAMSYYRQAAQQGNQLAIRRLNNRL